jgi:hypothetical protein
MLLNQRTSLKPMLMVLLRSVPKTTDLMCSTLFLNSSPVIGTEAGEIVVKGMQRTKVVSITLSKQKAHDFYESLKSMFEE